MLQPLLIAFAFLSVVLAGSFLRLWLLGLMIGTLLVLNTGVLRYVLKRQDALEKSLETIRDEVAFLKKLIEQLLPAKPLL